MTEKLFYLDSHIKTFKAKVLSCEKGKHGYDVILDRTAFYPEGGGQPGDRGVIGGVTVTDTHEAGEQVVHYCESPVEVGAEVECAIDWDWRFRLMQQHSGEHMVSGFIHEAFGYSNVGFHMGKDSVTIDFDGPITEEQLAEIERKTNAAIWENTPVEVLYPNAEELEQLPYRSKKELTGQVRIVRFPGVDLCACCGVHVKNTGEIGLVKFLSCVKFHEGVRIEMLAGGAAMELLCGTWEQNREISGLLSAKPLETASAAARMQQELNDTKYRLTKLEDKLFRIQAEAYTGKGDVLLFEEDLKPDALRRLADAILHTCGGRCAVFSKVETGYQYAIGHEGGDLREFTKTMNGALNGRGGGKPNFVQGSVNAAKEEIEAFFRGE